jgi:hypothetical protein
MISQVEKLEWALVDLIHQLPPCSQRTDCRIALDNLRVTKARLLAESDAAHKSVLLTSPPGTVH